MDLASRHCLRKKSLGRKLLMLNTYRRGEAFCTAVQAVGEGERRMGRGAFRKGRKVLGVPGVPGGNVQARLHHQPGGAGERRDRADEARVGKLSPIAASPGGDPVQPSSEFARSLVEVTDPHGAGQRLRASADLRPVDIAALTEMAHRRARDSGATVEYNRVPRGRATWEDGRPLGGGGGGLPRGEGRGNATR